MASLSKGRPPAEGNISRLLPKCGAANALSGSDTSLLATVSDWF